MITYFGVNLKDSKYGFEISKDNFAIINNKSSINTGQIYSDEWCQEHYERCLKNYSINMRYFSSLSEIDFNTALSNFLKKHKKFIEVSDLNNYQNVSGYYLLVLGKYHQVYIGTSQNIKIRIMSHWSKIKQFDRVLFGSIENSILSIDCFRALDTTRIFVFNTHEILTFEDRYINDFPSKYLLNRTVGGIMKNGFGEAITKGRVRK